MRFGASGIVRGPNMTIKELRKIKGMIKKPPVPRWKKENKRAGKKKGR